MGRQKINPTKKIDNDYDRRVCFLKRKRGLLKKAIELSQLCDQKLFIAIYDEATNSMVTLKSS